MNTTSTYTDRRKYALATLDSALHNALVAEKVCKVDTSEVRYIDNPYGSAPTTTIQALTGTYTPAAYTTTDAGLTVSDEFIVSEHIYDFESALSNFDIFMSRIDEMTASVKTAMDKWVLNNLCEDGTGSYTTPAGGFSTPSNFLTILANIAGKLAGYENAGGGGAYIVVENSDLIGILQSQAASGFNFADLALRNGLVANMLGVEIYVVRDGTFVDATLGTTTVTNSGHRVAGLKGITTYAAPRGVQYDEKGVSGKTGKEVVVWGYCGFKAWVPRATLTIDITVAS